MLAWLARRRRALVAIAHRLVTGVPGARRWFLGTVRLGRPRIHFHSGRQLQLSRGDHHFSRLHSFGDNHEITLRLTWFYRAQFEGRIRFHDEDIWTVLADLDRGARYQLRVFQYIENQSHLYELRRPKRPIGVRRYPAQLHGAGPGLNRFVDKIEFAVTRLDVVAIRVRDNFQVRIVQISPDKCQVRLRDCEVRVNRIQPHDGEERRGSTRTDDVANIHVAQTGPTIDRRSDVTAVQIYLRGRDSGFRSTLIRLRGVPLLARGDVLGL